MKANSASTIAIPLRRALAGHYNYSHLTKRLHPHHRSTLLVIAFLASVIAVGTLGLWDVTPAARGAIQFSESFNYPAGPLAGNGPQPGSPPGQPAWTNSGGNAQVTSPGLSFPGVFSTGNRATTVGLANGNGDIPSVNLSSAIVGGTKWVAFLISQASGPANPGGFAVVGLNGNNPGGNNGIGMLFNENIYGIDTTVGSGPVTRARTSTAASGATTLLVVKLDFTTGMEYIFVNPATGGEPSNAQASASVAMGAAFQANGFNQIVLAEGFNSASFSFDELRVGTTFADVVPAHPPFFTGEVSLGNGVYYLQFASGNPFGYYSYLSDPHYIFHFDLGYEYVFDANDGKSGVYLYDFKSQGFFYTAPGFPFPYLYDFSLNAVLYYFPDANNPGRYTNSPRYFYNTATGQIITR